MKTNTILNAFILSFVLLLSNQNAVASSKVFTKDSFEKVKLQYKGKQWLMLLWSLDCPACFKELALLEKIRVTAPNIAIVLINVDDNHEVTQEREAVLNSFGFNTLDTLYFSEGSGDINRYLIDPSWFGELPRSYFIESNGKFHGKSGLVSELLLSTWLLDKPHLPQQF